MALDFFAGCVGGCAGVVIGYPLDTVKVRIQTQDPKFPMYRGTFHCLYTIVKQETARGLFKGMSSPIASVAGINALIFGVYGNVQRRLSDPESLASHAFAGAVAGVVQSFVSSPMELVKTRLQIQEVCASGKQLYKGPLDCTKQIWRSEGLRGVFRGLGVTVAREIPAFSVYFASYEAMTRQRDPAQPIGTLHMMAAGGFAGVFSWLFTYPIDLIKSRLQVDGMGDGKYAYKGVCDCVVQTYRAEGMNGFFRGMTSTLIRSFPVNAVTFSVVTWILRWTEPSASSSNNIMYQDASQLVQESLHNVAYALAQENQSVDWPYHCDTPWLAGWKRLGGQFALNFTGFSAMPMRNYATSYRGSDWLFGSGAGSVSSENGNNSSSRHHAAPGACSCNESASAAENGQGQHVKPDGQAAPCRSENCTGRQGGACHNLSHSQMLLCCHPAAV